MTDENEVSQFQAEPILRGLHGFQRDAVEHAFHRLFMAPESTRRFLVADEVGLGKTLIAKGVIAKTIEHLRHKVDRVDIVYICSNLGIARQNINRLNPLPNRDMTNAGRITLLPLHLSGIQSGNVNLVAFTPGTSLDVSASLGTAKERLLLFTLLDELWTLRGTGPANLLQGNVADKGKFREVLQGFRWEHQEALSRSTSLLSSFEVELSKTPNIRERFESLCGRFGRSRKYIPDQDRQDRNALVGELRAILARTCIAALEPDLIILDEFQRFKELLDPNTESGELANQLFSWSNADAKAHVLLLSATPYKPYTLQHEEAEDNHFRDFMGTVEFLNGRTSSTEVLHKAIGAYRSELLNASPDALRRLAAIKATIESILQKVMSRTERMAVAGGHNGMLRSFVRKDLPVAAQDLQSYVTVRGISDAVGAGDPVEYWKSAAYPINFMQGYQLKEQIKEHVSLGLANEEILTAIRDAQPQLLPFSKLQSHEQVEIPNAKFRELCSTMQSAAAFELLWLPPSLPAYALRGSFELAKRQGLTKRLVFSSWNVVPRSLAVLLSYEARRHALVEETKIGADLMQAEQSQLLRFALVNAHPTGMPVLTLLYPSLALARLCDPRQFHTGDATGLPQWEEIYTWAKQQVHNALLPLGIEWAAAGQTADESWYWVAPLLLDQLAEPAKNAEWWGYTGLASLWAGKASEDEVDDDAGAAEDTIDTWSAHVDYAREYISAGRKPVGPAPEDLVDVLALLGLAGPGVCALRALQQFYPVQEAAVLVRNVAAQVAWSFRGLLNRPQSIAVVRAGERGAPYWRLVLEYCARGCLSSVMNEYAHVVRDSCGVGMKPYESAITEIAKEIAQALSLRAATLTVDELSIDLDKKLPVLRDRSMATLFAMRFGSDKTDDAKQVVRDGAIRSAFNSPFWPFVLATTSVGQEGLDFHWYCHAVVHWNLPPSPVDLEQREGRIHRFKGHAVRKNVASRWGQAALSSDQADEWEQVFQLATVDAKPTDKGLVPYWLYPLEDGAWIERHISLYPLSRDEMRYESIMKALGAYRLVFGQPRQDELLAYLMNRLDAQQLKELEQVLRINLAPPRHN